MPTETVQSESDSGRNVNLNLKIIMAESESQKHKEGYENIDTMSPEKTELFNLVMNSDNVES